jgi:hypothetical protein
MGSTNFYRLSDRRLFPLGFLPDNLLDANVSFLLQFPLPSLQYAFSMHYLKTTTLDIKTFSVLKLPNYHTTLRTQNLVLIIYGCQMARKGRI